MVFEEKNIFDTIWYCYLCFKRLWTSRPALDFESILSQCGQGYNPTSRWARGTTRCSLKIIRNHFTINNTMKHINMFVSWPVFLISWPVLVMGTGRRIDETHFILVLICIYYSLLSPLLNYLFFALSRFLKQDKSC
jgi:hypothetical protein